MGYPQPFGTVAAHRLAFIAGTAIQSGAASLFQANNVVVSWHIHGERQIGIGLALCLCFFGGKDEMGAEHFLGIKVDASGHKKRIELLDAVKVILAECMDAVFIEIKRLCFFLKPNNDSSMLVGNIQQRTAYFIHQMVWIGTTDVFREHTWKGLDETDEIIGFLFWRTEATGAVIGHDKLVTMNATAIAVQTDIRGITKSVTAVQGVTGVKKDFLDVYPVEVVLIGKVVGTHGHPSILFIFPFRVRRDLG